MTYIYLLGIHCTDNVCNELFITLFVDFKTKNNFEFHDEKLFGSIYNDIGEIIERKFPDYNIVDEDIIDINIKAIQRIYSITPDLIIPDIYI